MPHISIPILFLSFLVMFFTIRYCIYRNDLRSRRLNVNQITIIRRPNNHRNNLQVQIIPPKYEDLEVPPQPPNYNSIQHNNNQIVV